MERSARIRHIRTSLMTGGADSVGLCCTRFGRSVDEDTAPFVVVDSTNSHEGSLVGVLEKIRT
jgi:aspartate/glutamate racemase